ncbi:MAG TPA: hypothetical protein VGO40_06650 [Longimicrobium sp.]|nr:hypothetical protein [Longimicrobium sp.]
MATRRFAEVLHHHVSPGGPMRMGSYGVLDDMTLMHHLIEPAAGGMKPGRAQP